MSTSAVMGTLKKLMVAVLVGFALGAIVATLVAPSMLAWYYTPGSGEAMCKCSDLVRETTSRLVFWQVAGGGIGAAASVAVWVSWLRRAERKRLAATPAQPSSSTPAPPA